MALAVVAAARAAAVLVSAMTWRVDNRTVTSAGSEVEAALPSTWRTRAGSSWRPSLAGLTTNRPCSRLMPAATASRLNRVAISLATAAMASAS